MTSFYRQQREIKWLRIWFIWLIYLLWYEMYHKKTVFSSCHWQYQKSRQIKIYMSVFILIFPANGCKIIPTAFEMKTFVCIQGVKQSEKLICIWKEMERACCVQEFLKPGQAFYPFNLNCNIDLSETKCMWRLLAGGLLFNNFYSRALLQLLNKSFFKGLLWSSLVFTPENRGTAACNPE